jgi:excisionase family DNA binding protein
MLYSQKEAAAFLNVSVKTVERARVSGRLNCRRIGSAIRFTQGDLDEFILKSSVRPLLKEPDESRNRTKIWEVTRETHTA